MIIELTKEELEIIESLINSANVRGVDSMRVIIGLVDKLRGEDNSRTIDQPIADEHAEENSPSSS
jgi:hypothetical protein